MYFEKSFQLAIITTQIKLNDCDTDTLQSFILKCIMPLLVCVPMSSESSHTHRHTQIHTHNKPSNRMWLEFEDWEGRCFTVITFCVFSFFKCFLRYLNVLLNSDN